MDRHEGPVWQLCWAHPMYGSVLASCGYDRKVIIWKETNGSWDKLFEYSNHDSSGKQDLGHSVKEGTRVDQIIFQSSNGQELTT